ncbi:MAG: hypothetical protein ABI323_12430 [Solirubrobacteraceae bacterium]
MLKPVNGKQHLGAGRLFADDASLVLLLLNEAQRRAISRLTGLSGLSTEESLLLTVLALSAAAKALDDAAPSVAAPQAEDFVLAGATLGELFHVMAGRPSRTAPGFVALVAFAWIWKNHPLARGSFSLARASAHITAVSERRLRAYYQRLSTST